MLNETAWGEPNDEPGWVLVHGLGGAADEWTALTRLLSHGFTLDIPALRDDSRILPTVDLEHSLSAFARAHPGLGWVAHSYAGHALIALALAAPELVRCVATIGTRIPEDKRDAIQVPLLTLAGRNDDAFTDVEVVHIEGAGHAPHIDRPDVIADVLRRFCLEEG